jgi:hypothetical protein
MGGLVPVLCSSSLTLQAMHTLVYPGVGVDDVKALSKSVLV